MGLCFFYNSRHAHFSHDLATLSSIFRSCAALGLENLALRHQIGVLQRSARKRPKLTLRGPPVVDPSVPPLVRLALGAGHCQPRNGHSLASCRRSFVLDLEVAARPTRTTRHFPRGPRSDLRNVPRQPQLGRTPHPRRTAETRSRYTGEQRKQIHGARPHPPLRLGAHFWRITPSSWSPSTSSRCPRSVSRPFYVFLVLAHDRRRILHFNVTADPTAEWTAQQLREAFPFDQLPRYLLRDRDAIFGNDFREQVRDMGISEVLSAPRSPWQRAYVERVIAEHLVAIPVMWRSFR